LVRLSSNLKFQLWQPQLPHIPFVMLFEEGEV
jgi:hypothetical protein